MGHFGVGINENVFLEKAAIDDKLWMTITFGQKQEKAFNAFEAMQAEDVEEQPKTTVDIKLFNLKVPKEKDNKGNTRTKAQLIEMITRDYNKLKAVYLHIARGYLTKDQTKFDPYRACGISTTDEFNVKILQQPILDQITKNLATDFINWMKPFFGSQEQLFRLKLRRQDKDKHFATLPDQYLDENPFWESMDIPASASKVKFSKFELDNGLNDPTPTSRSSSDKPGTEGGTPTDEAPTTAESVFGS